MDALGFVMGERASNLRVKHTRDLIHGAHIGKAVSKTASVTMRYCNDNDEELNFCRIVAGMILGHCSTLCYYVINVMTLFKLLKSC